MFNHGSYSEPVRESSTHSSPVTHASQRAVLGERGHPDAVLGDMENPMRYSGMLTIRRGAKGC